MQIYIRTCQECGHEQQSKPPIKNKGELTKAYIRKQCAKCKSESLCHGSYVVVPPYTEAEKLDIALMNDLNEG